MKRPSFQFYPGDWQGNPKLKRCTHAEKGMWMDVLCLLHDGDSYGILRWKLSEIAKAIGTTEAKISGLVSKGVLKGSDDEIPDLTYTPRSGRKVGPTVILIPQQAGPIWFSSRMVEDEYKATVRGGTPNPAPNQTPKTTPNTAPMGINGDGLGAHQTQHQTQHPSCAITPAAPSSSSSTSLKESSDHRSIQLPSEDAREIGDAFEEAIRNLWPNDATIRPAVNTWATAQQWLDAGLTRTECIDLIRDKLAASRDSGKTTAPRSLMFLKNSAQDAIDRKRGGQPAVNGHAEPAELDPAEVERYRRADAVRTAGMWLLLKHWPLYGRWGCDPDNRFGCDLDADLLAFVRGQGPAPADYKPIERDGS